VSDGDKFAAKHGEGDERYFPDVHNCLSCRYHDEMPVQTPDGKPVVGQTQTICRRNPPTVVSMQVPTPQGISVNLLPVFPAVNVAMWCYAHEQENGAEDVSE